MKLFAILTLAVSPLMAFHTAVAQPMVHVKCGVYIGERAVQIESHSLTDSAVSLKAAPDFSLQTACHGTDCFVILSHTDETGKRFSVTAKNEQTDLAIIQPEGSSAESMRVICARQK